MKFACDRCGKRYASVDQPAAGRVYRIRCRCGHVIVVRGPASPPRDADAGLARFEPPPLPPPLAPPAPDAPSGAGAPPSAPSMDVTAARAERPVEAASAGAPARASAERTPTDHSGPVIQDDPFLRAASAEPDLRGAVWASEDESWAKHPERGGDPLADGGAALESAAAALPAIAARPALSLGLDEEGPAGARRRVLLAAIVALLGAATALAVWSM